MIVSAASGLRGLVIDLDAGRPVRWCRWADTDTGEYEAFRSDPDEARRLGQPVTPLLYRGRARLRFVPAVTVSPPRPSDPRDLAGSLEEARRRYCRPILALPGRGCEERLCNRLAEYEVSDEVEIEPEIGDGGGAYERAVTVGVRRYCAWHFRGPTFTSMRGVESEVGVATRPQ